MTIDSADNSKISNQTINTNRISNRTYDSKSNRITKLRRSLVSDGVYWINVLDSYILSVAVIESASLAHCLWYYIYAVSDAELENRLQEAGTLHRAAVELCQKRAGRLQKALDIAEHLHSVVADISSQLNHILNDSRAIHSAPATDRSTIQQHLSEIQVCANILLLHGMHSCEIFIIQGGMERNTTYM